MHILLLAATLAAAAPSTGTIASGLQAEAAETQKEAALEFERAKAEIQEAFDYLRIHAPMVQKMLDYLRAESPADFRRKVRELVDFSDDPQLRERLAASMKMEAAIREKALALSKAPEADRPALRRDLEKQVALLFDAKMETRDLIARKLEKEAGELRREVSRRRAKKAELVKKRVAELTGTGDDLDW